MVSGKKFFYFAIYILFLWPTYIALKIDNLPALSPARLVLFFLVLFFVTYFLLKRESIFYLMNYFTIIILFFIFLIWSIFVSCAIDENTMKSLYQNFNWFLFGPFLSIYIFLFFYSNYDLHKIVYAIFFMMIIANIFGLLEYYKGDLIFKNYLITSNEYTLSAIVEKTRDGIYRIRSVFSNPLVYAQIIVATLPLNLYIFLSNKFFYIKFISIFNIGLSYFLLYQTNSRAGILLSIAIPIIILHFLFIRNFRYRYISNIFIFFLSFFLLFLLGKYIYVALDNVDYMHKDFLSGHIGKDTLSTLARILQHKLGFVSIMRQPFTGFGSGSFLSAVYPLKTIDSYYLQILLSSGFIGLGIMIYFFYYILKKAFRSLVFYRDNLSAYLLASLLAILIFYFVLAIYEINSLFFIVSALIIVRAKLLKEKNCENKFK